VTQVKNKKTDSYDALQIAFGSRKEKNINKPQLGHFKAAGVKPARVREFHASIDGVKVGDVITVATFKTGDVIDVTGTSKGKGFAGVVKRYHFAGGRKSHGNKDQLRMHGSIGAKGPAHVFKNTRMPGRMGNETVTVRNLEVVKVDEANNLLFIKGAIPGAINGFIEIKGQGDLVCGAPVVTPEAEPETVVAETVETAAETAAAAEPETATTAEPETATAPAASEEAPASDEK
jgi:large subunit ribosomal protein L3